MAPAHRSAKSKLMGYVLREETCGHIAFYQERKDILFAAEQKNKAAKQKLHGNASPATVIYREGVVLQLATRGSRCSKGPGLAGSLFCGAGGGGLEQKWLEKQRDSKPTGKAPCSPFSDSKSNGDDRVLPPSPPCPQYSIGHH